MTDQSHGDAAQIRLIAEQLARAMVIEVRNEERKDEQEAGAIPPMLKWVGALISGVLTALITAGCIWMAVTLAEMKTEVAKITSQLGQGGVIEARFQETNRRIDRLEAIQSREEREGGRRNDAD